MQLSKNFTLEELISSNTAIKHKISNKPSNETIMQLKRLCTEILQPIRDKYGDTIHITSGYRCPQLNKIVKGSPKSQHVLGQAADISICKGYNGKLFKMIKDMVSNNEIIVGQLIWEYGTKIEPNWVHVSLPTSTKKNNILYLY